MSNLPEKYMIPKERIPKPFSQDVYKDGNLYTNVNSCVTCSIVKVIEVLYAIKNGYYTELSKGYAYVRHSGESDNGTVAEIVLNSMIEKKTGTVPYDMCPDYTEKPEIRNIILSRPDLEELDKEAEKWNIEKWECVKGNNNEDLKANVKKYIDTYNVPLIGTLKKSASANVNHSVVIVGYDDKYIYYHNHDRSGDVVRAKYDEWLKSFYYIAIPKGGTDMKKFKDVEDSRWSKKYIDKACEEGIINGVSEENFAPSEPVTREQMVAVLCRALYGME